MPHHNCAVCDLSADDGKEMVECATLMLQNAMKALLGIGQNARSFYYKLIANIFG